MKTGDLVRFPYVGKSLKPTVEDISTNSTSFPGQCIVVGLLVEYHTWEKIATILSDGKIMRIHASEVQKAGKKDIERFKVS